MPGSDFASAELIDAWDRRIETLPTGEDHYYRFVITNSSNLVSVTIDKMDSTPAGDQRITIYDSTEAVIDAEDDDPAFFTDLAIDTYYIKVSEVGSNSIIDYRLETYIEEGGNQPSPLNTDMVEEIPELDAIGAPVMGVEYDLTPYDEEPPLSGNYVAFDQKEYEHAEVSATKNVTSYKTRNPITINGINNNRIFGNQTEAQYSINGTVKREGVAVQNGLLRLYDRASGELIDSTYSDVSGNYSFAARVDPDFKYYIVAFDDIEAPILQAVIHDFLDPILETI